MPEPKTDTTAQPARQMTRTFLFPVVIKLSRHNKKTAYFPPEPKTDTTAQPARQTTVTFFFPVVINPHWKFGFTNLSIGDTQEHQLGIYPEKKSLCFNILNYMP